MAATVSSSKSSRSRQSSRAAAAARPSSEMNQRMSALLQLPRNQVCADCPAKRPLWASFLSTDTHHGGPKHMGVLVCQNCAQHHHFVLGEKRCQLKYLKMAHEWSLPDVLLLEHSGNGPINRALEAELTPQEFDKELVLDKEEDEDERRSKFIKHKYKKHKYADQLVYHELVLKLLRQERGLQPEEEEEQRQAKPAKEEPEATNSRRSSVSPKPSQNNHHHHRHTEGLSSAKQSRPSSNDRARRASIHTTEQAKSKSPPSSTSRASSKNSLHDSCPNLNLMLDDLKEFENETPNNAPPSRGLERRESRRKSRRRIVEKHEDEDQRSKKNNASPPSRGLERRESRRSRDKLVEEDQEPRSKSTASPPSRGLERRESRRSRRKLVEEEEEPRSKNTASLPSRGLERRESRRSRRKLVEGENDKEQPQRSNDSPTPSRGLERKESRRSRRKLMDAPPKAPKPSITPDGDPFRNQRRRRRSRKASLHDSCPNLSLSPDEMGLLTDEEGAELKKLPKRRSRNNLNGSCSNLLDYDDDNAEDKEDSKTTAMPKRRSRPNLHGSSSNLQSITQEEKPKASPNRSPRRVSAVQRSNRSASNPNLLLAGGGRMTTPGADKPKYAPPKPLRESGSNKNLLSKRTGSSNRLHHGSSPNLLMKGVGSSVLSTPRKLASRSKLSRSNLSSAAQAAMTSPNTSPKRNADWGIPPKPKNKLQGLADDFIRTTIISAMQSPTPTSTAEPLAVVEGINRAGSNASNSSMKRVPSRVTNISHDLTESTVDTETDFVKNMNSLGLNANATSAAVSLLQSRKKNVSSSGLSNLRAQLQKTNSSRSKKVINQ